jgi:nicotinate-nucleotide adenylyltransferase
MSKIGLFFGSFNPIHVGHLLIANYMVEFTELDKLWFVVTPHNPLKIKNNLLNDRQRLEMVRLAIDNNYKYGVSDIEFNLEKPSYTVKTLAYLSEKYSQHQFYLIIGSDNLQTFNKWKSYESILSNYKLLVYPRPGFDGGEFKNHPSVIFTQAPVVEISSTFIRDAVKAGKSVEFFMPEASFKYMNDMHFYKK